MRLVINIVICLFLECFNIKDHMRNDTYCTFDNDCLGVTCCLTLDIFIYRHSHVVFTRYDPARRMITYGIDYFYFSIDIPEGDFGTSSSFP